jgi:hypothetical protein
VITRDQLAGSVIASAAADPDNRVGRYVLVGALHGETWKAWDTKRGDWAQVTFVPREEQDRLRPRAAVTHPGLVGILELGAADDRTFVAAEHVQGMTLATAPRDDRRRLAGAIRDAAGAVGAIHARGLFHGALSLEVILIDGEGVVRVAGWGSGDDDVQALGRALFEVLTDRPAPKDGAPKSWPKRLDDDYRKLLAKALTGRYCGARAFADDLSRLL